ncbi:arsenate reductase/protein-tyrosine-phosphatase family protein [Ornithinimicrobium sp. CNJ-824]|uniref:arsenate reductase/protein-tyrosine-phosphatase family protein n=1 Tax=Ornithinimicrobium sp. CNJ-824 TaxID=1904966 RepID=UPI00406BFD1E
MDTGRILVVCTGNVCRSPLVERLLQQGLDERWGPGAFEVRSAGTGALVDIRWTSGRPVCSAPGRQPRGLPGATAGGPDGGGGGPGPHRDPRPPGGGRPDRPPGDEARVHRA